MRFPPWGDLLTAYDETAITYDEIGNPLSDGTRTYTWEHGRELSSLRENNLTWSYTYDSNGLRTSRGSREKSYRYVYSGSKLVQMTVDGYTFNFTYDASGTPLTVSLNNYTYYYITNAQGDVVGLINPNAEVVVRYTYDAWGNVEILYDNDRISDYNPLLYRGYVYDFETGLYYLQSRYYDPEMGRFINADGLVSTGQGLLGNNMFAYCENSPINRIDPSGNISENINSQYMVCEAHEGGWPFIPIRDKYTKINGIINGQGVFSNAHENMALGTYANNGCGIIALYNAMQLLDKPKSLGSIEDTIFLCGGMLLGGFGGIKAESIGMYFTLCGVDWSFYSSYSKLTEQICEGSIVVFMVKIYNSGRFHGFHYMTAQYTNGGYLVYNLYNNSVGPVFVDSIETVGNTRWLCGYIVGGS